MWAADVYDALDEILCGSDDADIVIQRLPSLAPGLRHVSGTLGFRYKYAPIRVASKTSSSPTVRPMPEIR
jgi:hypothetical protein